ncbi:hypothetical protein Ancab_018980 [Ancistrocladus abbreviatus]
MNTPKVVELIQPSVPTSPHLRAYKFSMLDQLSPSVYVPVILFYPNQFPVTAENMLEISRKLKNSLARTLAQYYPFAGRVEDKVTIDCNDEGVEFSEAGISHKLADILKQPQSEMLGMFLPDDLAWKKSENGAVLAIRLSFFTCGGFAVAVFPPQLIAASVFPPDSQSIVPEVDLIEENVVPTRFIFSPTKIAALKAKIISNSPAIRPPTRVEAVTALIHKYASRAMKTTSYAGILKPSVLAQTVKHATQNDTPSTKQHNRQHTEEGEMKLDRLVGQMREGLVQLCNFAKNMEGDQLLSVLSDVSRDSSHTGDAFKCTSWCGFPVYEVDFGWGKPAWASTLDYPGRNNIIMMDTKCGEGIEAWVTLDKQVMAILQCDEEFLEFASLNTEN